MKRSVRALIALGAVVGALALAPAAQAEVPSVFDGAVDCEVQEDGARFCGGSQTTVETFDGVPLDINFALPPEPGTGPDGDYPLVMRFHGWGGSKADLDAMRRFLDRGYAVFTMSDRGWGDSCGGLSPTRLSIVCLTKGYIRLLDTRYDVRDAQEFAGRLVDEGLVDPQRIGAIGGSYGGGMSMSLAALRDRKMLPDGSLVPWTSPDGTPMRIAAATPEIPWTDLAYALLPNGRTLDYVADATYTKGPIGVLKLSFVAGLFATGLLGGSYALPATDPQADIITWYALVNAGEPYDGNPLVEDIRDQAIKYHSSYYIDHSQPPAPLLISNGWTDDIFPVDEAIRFYNRTRSEHPDADISLMFLDFGHMRAQNKEADIALLHEKEDAWFDHYLKGEGPEPEQGVTTLTQTCDGPSEGPFEADSWAQIAPGEVRHENATSQTILPVTSGVTTGLAFDPIGGGGACATTPGDDQLGAATYRLDAAPAGGYTLMGSPTVIADISAPLPTSQVAARLLDVAPDGSQTLVARGLYRPDPGGRQVFQLHPGAWKFEQGHVAKLELLPNDLPYSRPSNLQGPVTVSGLELRLPVLELPDGDLIQAPAPKLVPEGYELAPGYSNPDPDPNPDPDTDTDDDGVLDPADECPDLAGDPPSGCPTEESDLTLKYKRGPAAFRGKLSADESACVPDRAVSVFKKVSGDDKLIGEAATDADGRYSVPAKDKRGRYYAEAAESTVEGVATCAAARSQTLRIK